MTPDEIRTELLAQHQDLRTRIRQVRDARRQDRPDQPYGFRVREVIAGLVNALQAHNRREEELLADLLPTVDAWGPVRKELMGDQHRAEHMALCGAFATLTLMSDSAAAASLLHTCLDCILEHMDLEEKTFLDELSLGASDVVADQVSG